MIKFGEKEQESNKNQAGKQTIKELAIWLNRQPLDIRISWIENETNKRDVLRLLDEDDDFLISLLKFHIIWRLFKRIQVGAPRFKWIEKHPYTVANLLTWFDHMQIRGEMELRGEEWRR